MLLLVSMLVVTGPERIIFPELRTPENSRLNTLSDSGFTLIVATITELSRTKLLFSVSTGIGSPVVPHSSRMAVISFSVVSCGEI